MTIRLLTPYGRYPHNAIVSLDAETEAALIASGTASAATAGGVQWVDINADDPPASVTLTDYQRSKLVGGSLVVVDAAGVMHGAQSPVSGGGLSGPIATAWSTVWDTASAKDFGSYTIAGALAITSSDTGSVVGGYSQATLVADGANVPTFDGSSISGWINTAGARNAVTLMRLGDSVFWACAQVTGRQINMGGLPGQVTGLTLGTATTTTQPVTWSAPTGSPTDYIVQWALAGSGTWNTFADGTSTSTSATVTGLTAGVNYDYRVAAVNGAGTGSYSSTVTGYTADAQLRLASLTNMTETVETGGYGYYPSTASGGVAQQPSVSIAAAGRLMTTVKIIGWTLGFGLDDVGTGTASYTAVSYYFYQHSSNIYQVLYNGAGQTKNGADAALTVVSGDQPYLEISAPDGGGNKTITAKVYRPSNSTTYVIHTYTQTANATLYPVAAGVNQAGSAGARQGPFLARGGA